MPKTDDVCQTCSNTYAWHEANPEVRHPFNNGSMSSRDVFGSRDKPQRPQVPQRGAEPGEMPPAASWPMDPVLRMALINKGILTPDDLTAAEAVIRSTTRQVWEVENGQFGGRQERVRVQEPTERVSGPSSGGQEQASGSPDSERGPHESGSVTDGQEGSADA